ncbi:unnamed protein product [Owenia fusiformis]|uniref:N-acetylgalactosaminide beta-1,3-galactosyltransferase n=1 Tax=Owenia fusiformis TaxID=6347 RepID=A0A8S4Q3S0_OWEFU|nr:unnamed protein product [Owenia fusiformis]
MGLWPQEGPDPAARDPNTINEHLQGVVFDEVIAEPSADVVHSGDCVWVRNSKVQKMTHRLYCGWKFKDARAVFLVFLAVALLTIFGSFLFKRKPILTGYNSIFTGQSPPKPKIFTNFTSGISDSPRIFCWMLTTPENLNTKAKAVRDTWSTRCDGRLFVTSDFTDDQFPVLGLGVPEGRDYLSAKSFTTFKYAYANYLNTFDWFLKADDDTYVIMENLRHFLMSYKPSEALYFGQYIPTNGVNGLPCKQGYSSGGAGYVLSREALRRMEEIGATDTKYQCSTAPVTGFEDADVGICLENLNVTLGESRDNQNHLTFHSFDPVNVLNKDEVLSEYYHYKKGRTQLGNGVDRILSNTTISFHYINPGMMYFIDFLLYDLHQHAGSQLIAERSETEAEMPSFKRSIFILVLLFVSVTAKRKTERRCRSGGPSTGDFKHYSRTLHLMGQGYKEVVVPKTPLIQWWHKLHNWTGRTTKDAIIAKGLEALQFFNDRYGIDLMDLVTTDELYFGNVSRIINVTPTESYRFRTLVLKWLPGNDYRVTVETIGKRVNYFENPAIVNDLMYEVVPLEMGVYGGTYSGKKTTNHIIGFGEYWIDFEKYCGLENKAVTIFHWSDVPADPPLYVCSVNSSTWGLGQGQGAIWMDGDRSVLQELITFPPP